MIVAVGIVAFILGCAAGTILTCCIVAGRDKDDGM